MSVSWDLIPSLRNAALQMHWLYGIRYTDDLKTVLKTVGKEATVAYFSASSQKLRGETEETHENS
jgi:hypothetical protein